MPFLRTPEISLVSKKHVTVCVKQLWVCVCACAGVCRFVALCKGCTALDVNLNLHLHLVKIVPMAQVQTLALYMPCLLHLPLYVSNFDGVTPSPACLQGPGVKVTGGTINFEGPLDIRALATGGRSTLAGEVAHTAHSSTKK